MKDIIDPSEFGLPARTMLEQAGTNTIAVVMKRKSRIIMADGRKIVEKANQIKKVRSKAKIILKTTAPVCSKTIQFLAEEGIKVIPLDR